MNILSLDGGGIRGVLTARILWRLERACPGFLDKVDVIAGASTGGIQALKLASGGKVTELTQLYEKRGNDIFRDRDALDAFSPKMRIGLLGVALAISAVLLAVHQRAAALIVLIVFLSLVTILHVFAKLDELWRADYSAEHMEEVLKDELTDHLTMRDLSKIVLIPTFDQRTWNPKFFDNFPGDERDLDQKLWEVARCTSAAPTYWPSHQWCLDGGLFANNPSDSAVAGCLRYMRRKHMAEDADLQGISDKEAYEKATVRSMGKITVLSLGTGEVPHKAPADPSNDVGILYMIPMLLNVVMDGAVKASAFRTSQGLNGRHVRVQPKLPGVIDLADVGSIPELIQIADLTDLEPAVRLIREHWMAGDETPGDNPA
jgi:patatin-like phospholipase/acyl hydrolase